MSEYKRCTDCKHYKPPGIGDLGRCLKIRSVVDGGPVIGRGSHPEYQRAEPRLVAVILGTCGRTARWFEPKTVLPERALNSGAGKELT